MIDPRSAKDLCKIGIRATWLQWIDQLQSRKLSPMEKKKTQKQSMKMIMETLQFWAEKKEGCCKKRSSKRKMSYADGKKKTRWKGVHRNGEIYYEDALRANQGKAESDENGRGAADIKPQPDEDLEDADLEDESPRKRQLNMKERTSNKAINYRRCKGGTRLQIKDGQEQSEDHDEDYDVLIRGVMLDLK